MAPAPVNSTTFTFFSLAALVIGYFYFQYKRGNTSKDNFQIVAVVVPTLTFFTWLLWLCAWMHQWHPLLKPEWGTD